MDIFRFLNPTNKLKMEQGKLVNGLKSIMWIERYREPGEFTITASADSDIKAQLPIGSFISHTNTAELMIVENHEIKDDRDKESDIVITGRSFETVLESRIVGNAANRTYPRSVAGGVTDDFNLSTSSTCANAAVYLISSHTQVSYLANDDDAMPWLVAQVYGSPGGTNGSRVVKRGTVHERLVEVLEIDNLGVKIVRPSPTVNVTANTIIGIHKGTDKSKEVIRSYDTGEVESIDYFWSNRTTKNAALVYGKWVEVMVNNAALKEYDRKIMVIDASDIDQDLASAPSGATLTQVADDMRQRGYEVLAQKNDVAITKAEVAKSAIKYTYRKDYNVGDLITVSGDYNEVSVMRVSEYVEIEDETGESGYPTLSFD